MCYMLPQLIVTCVCVYGTYMCICLCPCLFLLCQFFSVCGSASHNTVHVSILQCVWQCSTQHCSCVDPSVCVAVEHTTLFVCRSFSVCGSAAHNTVRVSTFGVWQCHSFTHYTIIPSVVKSLSQHGTSLHTANAATGQLCKLWHTCSCFLHKSTQCNRKQVQICTNCKETVVTRTRLVCC